MISLKLLAPEVKSFDTVFNKSIVPEQAKAIEEAEEAMQWSSNTRKNGEAIQGVIDQIWDTYDVDESGSLDKEETRRFVQDTLGKLGSDDEFSEEAFDQVFLTFDTDESGFVEKDEMVFFIMQLLAGTSW